MKKLLALAGLFSRLEPALLLYSSVEGHTKSEKAFFFTLAASRAGVAASRCIFVGEDAKEPETAEKRGPLLSAW
jgi:hypothetical protein